MILSLPDNSIFVFGSNLAGRHGKSAARDARIYFGAQPGIGRGRTGQCYAIPTKDRNLRTLSLTGIAANVREFLRYAMANPQLTFYVTPIGCGLAGYAPEQIAPMFADSPENVRLPSVFK